MLMKLLMRNKWLPMKTFGKCSSSLSFLFQRIFNYFPSPNNKFTCWTHGNSMGVGNQDSPLSYTISLFWTVSSHSHPYPFQCNYNYLLLHTSALFFPFSCIFSFFTLFLLMQLKLSIITYLFSSFDCIFSFSSLSLLMELRVSIIIYCFSFYSFALYLLIPILIPSNITKIIYYYLLLQFSLFACIFFFSSLSHLSIITYFFSSFACIFSLSLFALTM